LRRISAPVKGPTNGTPAASAIGFEAAEVGVPTEPMRAKTLLSMSFLVASMVRFGS
jgi:hypothetical protein